MDVGRIIRPLQAKLDEAKADGLDVMLCSTEIIEKVIALLKEQEAVEPLTIDDAVGEIMDKHYKRLKEQEEQIKHICQYCQQVPKQAEECIKCGEITA
jgi:hypothetical protein